MATITGKKPADTYKDLLQVSNSNNGIDATLRPIEDGEGTLSPLELSATKVNIASGFQLGGVDITATPNDINKSQAPYVESFNNTTDWGSPSGGEYTIVIPDSSHNLGLEVSHISVYEIVGNICILNYTDVSIDNTTGDVSFSVAEIPDNRFTGKIVIT